MNVHEDMLIENGRKLINERRLVWDLERKYRNKSSFYEEELKKARRRYRELLAERKELVRLSQQVMFR